MDQATQTVSASTAITSVNYLVSTNCTDTTTVSATNLPPGVTMNYTSSSGGVVVSGTPSGAATGTYNYSILQCLLQQVMLLLLQLLVELYQSLQPQQAQQLHHHVLFQVH